MTHKLLSRRDFSVRLASVASFLGVAGSAFGSTGTLQASPPAGNDEVSHACECIHQEVVFKASRKRVYEALTDAKRFDKVVELSGAMKSGMVPAGKSAEISRDAGGAFSIFGGYISGRQIELVVNERIVQAWRAGNWKPGVFSIAKFELADEGNGTKLTLDHGAFPNGAGQHLAEGWHENYWEPLAKYLA
ncbi:MAG: SRPBCC domain-containing protein [Terriglobales bacterium]|jgi:uncharacterized protein YndB with AHSA1/START domain